MFSLFLFLLQVLSALYLFGLIWFVQLVHYPMFRFLNDNQEHNPFLFHQGRTSIVVVPMMLLELITAILLVFFPYPNFFVAIIFLALTLLIWLSTFTLQVPAHQHLKDHKDDHQINRLIWTNWFRTFLWSIKAIYIFFILWNLLSDVLIVVC